MPRRRSLCRPASGRVWGRSVVGMAGVCIVSVAFGARRAATCAEKWFDMCAMLTAINSLGRGVENVRQWWYELMGHDEQHNDNEVSRCMITCWTW